MQTILTVILFPILLPLWIVTTILQGGIFILALLIKSCILAFIWCLLLGTPFIPTVIVMTIAIVVKDIVLS